MCDLNQVLVLETEHRSNLGIDIGAEPIGRCRQDHPNLQFEVADVLEPGNIFDFLKSNANLNFKTFEAIYFLNVKNCTEVWQDEKLNLKSFDTVFLDIGGDREAAPVVQVMQTCLENIPNLQLFVIKCEQVAAEAIQFLESNGLEDDGLSMKNGSSFFEQLTQSK